MEGFGLLVGHMLGDYILQNDWMAGLKFQPSSYRRPGDPPKHVAWLYVRPMTACTVHCTLYTLAVWACSFWWMPWWGLVACFLAHWPIDRWRLAGRWMRSVSGQAGFADGPMAPWSIIVVDNTFHLLTLFAIGIAKEWLCS